MVVQAGGGLRHAIVIDGSAAVLFRQELFDLPVVLLRADAELEIFFGDGVPVLRR